MINEAIILAGGLGTRLQSEISDRPKCLAPVNGIPFLSYVIHNLLSQDIRHFIFSLGYKKEMIIDFLNIEFAGLSYSLSLEDKQLGTGGAILLACEKVQDRNILICNGDTLYKVETTQLETLHLAKNAACTLALKPMKAFDRYGTVTLDDENKVIEFKEKQFCAEGLINGGVYILDSVQFLEKPLPEIFSFENQYLDKESGESGKIYGCVQDGYFIDIGVPEDYRKAFDDRELNMILHE